MKLNAQNIQRIQGYLRNVAEVDPNDIIANRASQLAVDLELVCVPFEYLSLSEAEQALVQYAIRKREQYVLLQGHRHATDLQRVEKQRRTIKKVDNDSTRL
jgi:hypothetical protein